MPPEPFRKGAVGQERSGLSWWYFLLHEGSKKVGPLWAYLGYLPGIVATGGRRQVMFTLLRQDLPKGFNQVFESAPGPEPQNNNQGSLPDPQVAGASGFYLRAVLPAVPQLERDSLSQKLRETWRHPSRVGPLLTGPICTVNYPHPSALKPLPLVTAPFFLTSITENSDPFQPVCLLTASQMHHTLSTHQICLGGSYLPRLPLSHSFYLPKTFQWSTSS